MNHRQLRPMLVFALICLITVPSFFNIYRTLAFQTVPTDPYEPFLLYLTSHGGEWPGSPFGYRVLSVLPAVPLYYILPVYKFSVLRDVDAFHLKACEALAAVSYLFIAGTATMAFETVYRRLRLGASAAAFAAMLSLILLNFSGWFGVDPIGIFFIFLLFVYFESSCVFSVMFFVAPFLNEKIILFFVLLIAERSLLIKGFVKSHKMQNAAIVIGLFIYLGLLRTMRLPAEGNEYQTNLSMWIPHFLGMALGSVSSSKGIVLNILPSVVVTAPCMLFSLRPAGSQGMLAASDALVPLGLFAAALVFTFGFTVGHVVSFALPLTLMSTATLVATAEDKAKRRET